jgi:hypothetical protein
MRKQDPAYSRVFVLQAVLVITIHSLLNGHDGLIGIDYKKREINRRKLFLFVKNDTFDTGARHGCN